MDLDALPAVIGGHHRLNTGADRAYVPLGMDVAQLTLRSAVVPPVHPVGGTAVADEVLGGRDDMTCVQKRRTAHHTLQSADNATSVGPHDLGVLGVSLVRAPPPVIAHHGHDRGERPIDSGHRDFAGRDRTDALDKVRVVCCAESDVMREQCRADHVVMAVDRIRAPDDRYGGGA